MMTAIKYPSPNLPTRGGSSNNNLYKSIYILIS